MGSRIYCDDKIKFPRAWFCLLATIVTLLVSLIIILPLYYMVLRTNGRRGYLSAATASDWTPQCAVEISERFDCYPENSGVNKEQCSARGCCWTEEKPKCYYPGNYGYAVIGKLRTFLDGFEVDLIRLSSPSRYGDDISNLRLRVEFQTPYRVRIKYYDPDEERYEVEEPSVPQSRQYVPQRELLLYSVTYNESSVPFGVKVRRDSTGTVIFDTTVTGFTFANQFLQLILRLPSTYIYGLGDRSLQFFRQTFNHTTGIKLVSIYPVPQDHSPIHPMYICMEGDGNAHGVLLLNSNAMEVQLHTLPAVIFRTIGGILDFYLFLGPTPEAIVQQYTEAIGRPMMPPYWSLGYQMGRKGYLSVDHVKWIYDKTKSKNVSQDVQLISSDYTVDGCMFSESGKFGDLRKLSADFYAKGLRFVLSMHPLICATKNMCNNAYEDGLKSGIFVNDSWNAKPLVGMVDRRLVVFPDFENPATKKWWTDKIRDLHSRIRFDGISIERNEPYNSVNGSVNGCLSDNLNVPPYLPEAHITRKHLYDRTLCMDALQWGEKSLHRHYNLHNIYGHKMAMVTYQALGSILKGPRPLVLSHYTFIGTGKYAGKWFQSPQSGWLGLSTSISSILHYSLFGIPYTGAAICDSHRDAEEELCLRWIQVGAFYPLVKHYKFNNSKLWITKCSSNEKFGISFKKAFARVAQMAFERRYELLPYLYTLFHHAHIKGSTVARPLWHEFIMDNTTYNIESQFLWGPALLVSPALKKGVTSVRAYFPAGQWYDYYTGEMINSKGQWEDLPAELYKVARPINLHVRGGYIIPIQKAEINTDLSRRNALKLVVALNTTQQAEGYLFWDDGSKDSHISGEYVYIKITVSHNRLTVTGHSGKPFFKSSFSQLHIQEVRIMGLSGLPDYITIGESYLIINKQYRWNNYLKIMDFRNILIPLTSTTIIRWFD